MRTSLFTVLVMLASVLAAAPAAAQTDCTILGTEGDDVLFGTDGDDVVCGFGGNDILRGGRGNDIIDGGAGNDLLIGGAGRDQLRGGPGDDRLFGQSGRDRLVGNTGDDRLDGGGSRDRLIGGPGIDDCTDNRGPSKRRACEPVADLMLLDMAMKTWDSFDIDEFVYGASLTAHCRDGEVCIAALLGPSTVHVRNGVATSASPDLPGYTDTELFEMARAALLAGTPVSYEPTYGLPSELEATEGRLVISDLELRDRLREDLETAREKWERQGALDYSFTFHNICFCPSLVDVRVTVTDGEVTETEVLDEDAGTGFVPQVQSIDEHFDQIESLLDGHAIHVDAAFSDVLGYPASYDVDHSRLIADEELTVVIFDVDITRAVPVEEIVEATGPVLVDVGGITVAEEMAEQLAALLAAAAADGFELSGGGYRDPARQIELRRINCGPTDYDIWEKPAGECSPPTAIPGRSQHELGLAVDFTSSGSLVTSRTDPAFLWLVDNAASFGLFNHPQEPWHWSTTGN